LISSQLFPFTSSIHNVQNYKTLECKLSTEKVHSNAEVVTSQLAPRFAEPRIRETFQEVANTR
jgi:hypothetical protein